MNRRKLPLNGQPHLPALLLSSFILFNLGFVITEVFRWTNRWDGLFNGIFHSMFAGIFWAVTFLPWSCLVYALYRWQGWEKYRTSWILAPALCMFVFSIGKTIFDPQTPSARFERFTKTELPENARKLAYFFSGGGMADYKDIYSFETTPAETNRLITQLSLTETDDRPPKKFRTRQSGNGNSFQNPNNWSESKKLMTWDDDGHWFFELYTDSSRKKVYMVVGCI